MKYIKKVRNYIFIFTMLFVLVSPVSAEAATVKINKTKKTMYVGDTVTLKITGTSKKITWSSSNKKIATVTSKGKVTAKKAGNVTIKGKYGNKNKVCKITVKKKSMPFETYKIYDDGGDLMYYYTPWGNTGDKALNRQCYDRFYSLHDIPKDILQTYGTDMSWITVGTYDGVQYVQRFVHKQYLGDGKVLKRESGTEQFTVQKAN